MISQVKKKAKEARGQEVDWGRVWKKNGACIGRTSNLKFKGA